MGSIAPAASPALPAHGLALHVLAMSLGSPFSERELTAQNESPSLFYPLAGQEAAPASGLERPPAGSGSGFLLGDLWREAMGGEGLRSRHLEEMELVVELQ